MRGLEVFVFGRIAGRSAAEYAAKTKRLPLPDVSDLPEPTPEAIFREIASVLDACFDPLSDADMLRRGIAHLKTLPPFPHVRLAIAAMDDALSHR